MHCSRTTRTNSPLASSLALLPMLICVSAIVGCNSGLPLIEPAAEAIWPYDKKEVTTYHTPSKRIEALEELARDAKHYDAAKQQEISAVLAQQLRQESDAIIRRQIISTLGNYSAETALTVLHTGSQDQNPEVRIASCQALARRGGAGALAALDRALREDEDIDVRLAAAKALGKFKEQQAVVALGAALDDPDPALQYVAVESLKKSTGRSLGNDVNAWRQFAAGSVGFSPASTASASSAPTN